MFSLWKPLCTFDVEALKRCTSGSLTFWLSPTRSVLHSHVFSCLLLFLSPPPFRGGEQSFCALWVRELREVASLKSSNSSCNTPLFVLPFIQRSIRHPSGRLSIHPSSDQVGRLPLLPWWLAEVQQDSSCSPSLCVPWVEKGRRSSSDTGGTGTSGGTGEWRLLFFLDLCAFVWIVSWEMKRGDNYLPPRVRN